MPDMDAQRWSEIRAVFDEVVELNTEQRKQRLAAVAAIDPGLRRQVEALLSADAELTADLAAIEEMFASHRWSEERPLEPDPLRLTGQTVSHFTIEEAIAVGGMGVVYRAQDTRLHRLLALKFPLPSDYYGKDARERFLHEARSAAALDHQNICGIYEVGETDDGRLFLAMPLYDGETLKARIAREGALPVREAISITRQITEGVRAAHRAGIIHRDLKPANVMLLSDGTVKILDFGLAKVRDLTLTASSTRVGTVAYMAPEQIQGRPVDARTDLWAIGVMLYEQLTGGRPFAGDYDVSIAHAILHSQPPPASALCPRLDAGVDDVVATLLRKDPAQRYASADQLAEVLAELDGGRAARQSARAMRKARAPHLPGIIAAAAGLIVLLALGTTWLNRNAGRSEMPRTVAVLPFRNASADTATDYLGQAMADALAVELARLHSVMVPADVSGLDDSENAIPLRDAARELRAAAVIHGSVRRSADRIRVDVQVADSARGRRPWTRSYDLPASDLIAVERAVLADVIAALRLRVTAAERARLRRSPTNRAEAYELYLRGRATELRASAMSRAARRDALLLAQSFYARARDVDPGFALARARLALTYIPAGPRYDRPGPDPQLAVHSRAQLDQARLEAETALRADPELPEAHEALAMYWDRGQQEVAKAGEEIKLAIRGFPNSADYHLMLGDNYRRQGRWEEAVEQLQRAMQLEPRSPIPAASAAMTYSRMRRYEQSVKAWDRALALAPDNALFKVIRGSVFIRWQGTADTLAAAVRAIPHNLENDKVLTSARFQVARVQRQWPAALVAVNEAMTESIGDDMFYRPRALLRAEIYEALGDRARARSDYEAARALLVDSLTKRPDDVRLHIALGLAYAGLGRKPQAIAEARRAMQLVPLAQSSPGGTNAIAGAAEIFTKAGDTNAALDLLELMFSIPAGREVSVPLLRVDPTYDPLRSDPRFQRLLQRFSDG